MSPRTTVTDPLTSAAASRSSIAALVSMPVTVSPACAIGIASRPVPTPSSSRRPAGPAKRVVNATVASTSVTVAYQSSYTSANASP